jgi:hypothetical protein
MFHLVTSDHGAGSAFTVASRAVSLSYAVLAVHGPAGEWMLVENARARTHTRSHSLVAAQPHSHTRARSRSPTAALARPRSPVAVLNEYLPSHLVTAAATLPLWSLQAGGDHRQRIPAHKPFLPFVLCHSCSVTAVFCFHMCPRRSRHYLQLFR